MFNVVLPESSVGGQSQGACRDNVARDHTPERGTVRRSDKSAVDFALFNSVSGLQVCGLVSNPFFGVAAKHPGISSACEGRLNAFDADFFKVFAIDPAELTLFGWQHDDMLPFLAAESIITEQDAAA